MYFTGYHYSESVCTPLKYNLVPFEGTDFCLDIADQCVPNGEWWVKDKD